MCGRFTLKTPAESIRRQLALFPVLVDETTMDRIKPRYNIAPCDKVFVISAPLRSKMSANNDSGPLLELVETSWGMLSKSSKTTDTRIINIRAESLEEKHLLPSDGPIQRCLILADGYYEWEKSGGRKMPYYFYRPDQSLLLFAGLLQSREDDTAGDSVESCAIITVSANKIVAPIHDRMPAVLDLGDGLSWLEDVQKGDVLRQFLTSPPDAWFRKHSVHTQVNRVGFDKPQCINPIPVDRQPPLF